jgi:hypothetical protein
MTDEEHSAVVALHRLSFPERNGCVVVDGNPVSGRLVTCPSSRPSKADSRRPGRIDARDQAPRPRAQVRGDRDAVRLSPAAATIGAPAIRHAVRLDLLELDGEDLRALPLVDRKKRVARLLGRRRLGIVLSEHTDEDGATIFQRACKMGLEGIVSKRLSAPYRSGPSRNWIKVKNADSPAMIRAREAEW